MGFSCLIIFRVQWFKTSKCSISRISLVSELFMVPVSFALFRQFDEILTGMFYSGLRLFNTKTIFVICWWQIDRNVQHRNWTLLVNHFVYCDRLASLPCRDLCSILCTYGFVTWAKLFILTVCNDLYNLCLHTTSHKRFVQLKRRDFSTDFKFVIGILRLQTRNWLFVELFNACLSSGSEVSPLCKRSEDDNDKNCGSLWMLN